MFSARNPNDPPKQGNISFVSKIEGDIEAGYKQADYIIEYDTNLPTFASHIPNPPASIAWWYDDPYHSPGKSLRIEGAVQRRENIARSTRSCRKNHAGRLIPGGNTSTGVCYSQEIPPMLA
jgi:hypothetical protein